MSIPSGASGELESLLGARLDSVLSRRPGGVALVVVDSVTAVFRGEFEGEALVRAAAVHRVGTRLAQLAVQHGVAVLAVNQVSD